MTSSEYSQLQTNFSDRTFQQSYHSRTDLRNAHPHGKGKVPRICVGCQNPIIQNSLKALGRYYHEECFVCHDCGILCRPKFFPYKIPETEEVILLCQQDYFRRNKLLCFICNKPLCGVYYNTFGKLYDEIHFCCSICNTKLGISTCFHFEDKLYCKYHFLKHFSKRCKGCGYPISEQYIEFPRGEEIHCWHPECYGIHKYWNVCISPDSINLPPLSPYDLNSSDADVEPTPQQLEKYVQSFNNLTTKIWTVLYKFEEETAGCISDMFQYLTSFDQTQGINSTALFVLKIECLFKGLDSLDSLCIYHHDTPQISTFTLDDSGFEDNKNMDLKYSKFPKNLSTKVLIYLQLLRKLGTDTNNKEVNITAFMSIITGLAHFLKLLVRYGLYISLKYNKITSTTNALIKFLREVQKNETIVSNPFDRIHVSINATDCCAFCDKYTQEECIQYQDERWHKHCFYCSKCTRHIDIHDVSDAAYNKKTKDVLCAQCSVDIPESKQGFKPVSRLSQLIFLLKIALIRSKVMMELQIKNKDNVEKSDSTKETISMQQTYIRTLNDIKILKSKRQSVRVSQNKQDARKSRILETSEVDVSNENSNLNKSLVIEMDSVDSRVDSHPKMFNGTRTLTLDDISRIVAVEQARELRPDAFTHFKKCREVDNDSSITTTKTGSVYYSELSQEQAYKLQLISLSFISCEGNGLTELPVNVSKLMSGLTKATAPTNGFWNKVKVIMSKDTKKISYKKIFGTPLEILCVKWGVESDLGIGPVKIKIPVLLDELISSLRRMDMSIEGIFRKNGNIRKLKQLITQLDENPLEVPDLSQQNSIQLSALLKKFLRELPTPLLMFSLYDLWIEASKTEIEIKKHKIFSLLYSLLPWYHRNVAEVLFSFLHWTSSFSHIDSQIGSKMDIHNLSTVVTPNILYQESSTNISQDISKAANDTYGDSFGQNEGENHFLAIGVVEYLISHNEDLSVVPIFLLELLREVEQQHLETFEQINKHVTHKLHGDTIDVQQYDTIENINSKESISLAKEELSK